MRDDGPGVDEERPLEVALRQPCGVKEDRAVPVFKISPYVGLPPVLTPLSRTGTYIRNT